MSKFQSIVAYGDADNFYQLEEDSLSPHSASAKDAPPGITTSGDTINGFLLVRRTRHRKKRRPGKESAKIVWERRYFTLDIPLALLHSRAGKKAGSVPEASPGRFSFKPRNSSVAKNKHSSKPYKQQYLQRKSIIVESAYRDFCFTIRTPSEKKITLAAFSEEHRAYWMEQLKLAAQNAPPRSIKIVIVGDDVETQKKLLSSFFKQCHQEQLLTEVQRNNVGSLELNLEVTGELVHATICCVSEQALKNIRWLSYSDVSAFMLCYSTFDVNSFESLERLWFPEIEEFTRAKKNLTPSRFQVGISEPNKPSTVDFLVEEELAEKYSANDWFEVIVEPVEDPKPQAQSAVRIYDSDSEHEEAISAAELFLNVLEATLGAVDESLEDVSAHSDGNDSQNLLDTSDLHSNSVANIAGLMKGKMAGMFGNGRLSVGPGTMEKIKNVIKSLKPKKKRRKLRKKKLEEKEKTRAHFVSRHETGSLVFLGEDYLEE